MTVTERVAELLAGVPIEDVLRGREIGDTVEKGVVIERGAASFLGVSPSSTYRFIAERKLGHVKIEGRVRKGKGRSGAVRVRLLDMVTFMATNEVTAGATKATKSTVSSTSKSTKAVRL